MFPWGFTDSVGTLGWKAQLEPGMIVGRAAGILVRRGTRRRARNWAKEQHAHADPFRPVRRSPLTRGGAAPGSRTEGAKATTGRDPPRRSRTRSSPPPAVGGLRCSPCTRTPITHASSGIVTACSRPHSGQVRTVFQGIAQTREPDPTYPSPLGAHDGSESDRWAGARSESTASRASR